MARSKNDWQSISLRRELVDRLKELPDAKHFSLSALANRAMDEWLNSSTQDVTPTQAQLSIPAWDIDERKAVFFELARHLAADLIAENSEAGAESLEFLKAIIAGRRPTDGQIGELAHVSDFTEEQLIALREQLFPNGGKQQNGDPLNRL